MPKPLQWRFPSSDTPAHIFTGAIGDSRLFNAIKRKDAVGLLFYQEYRDIHKWKGSTPISTIDGWHEGVLIPSKPSSAGAGCPSCGGPLVWLGSISRGGLACPACLKESS